MITYNFDTLTLTVTYSCKIFYMQKVRDSATLGFVLDQTAVVVEAVQSVLNVYFYICLSSHGISRKWSWNSHGIPFPDLCVNLDCPTLSQIP